MDMTSVINQMITLLLLLIIGVITGKTGIVDEPTSGKLTSLTLNICQVGMILNSVVSGGIDLTFGKVILVLVVMLAAYAIMLPIGLLLPRLMRVPKADRGIYTFMTVFANNGFMGMPVVASVFGSTAVLYAAINCIPMNILAYSIGIMMISGGKGAKFDWKKMINPPIITTLLAIVLLAAKLKYPQPLVQTIQMLNNAVVPLSMIVIGSSLSRMKLKDIFGDWRIYAYLPVKLIAVPVAVWAVMRLFVHDTLLLGTVTVLAAMPAAVIASMFSIRFGGNVETASRGVFISTVFSIATIPLVIYLLLI